MVARYMGNKGKMVLMVQAIEKQHTAVVLLYLILGILLFSITFMILQEPYIRYISKISDAVQKYIRKGKLIRDLAAQELGLKTAKYFYAKTLDELKAASEKIGFPCVVKPLMSSSGKGQSLVKSADELEHAWEYGCNGSRGDIKELIIEEFIKFDSEITLLTVTQKNGPTLFCPPIGHVQKGGDYRESFQPAHIDPAHLKEAQEMAEKVTRALTGAGLWGVEFFLSHENGVYFSELSPRPHDTGMVTLAGTQNLNEFELHLRAVLGLPIPNIKQERIGAEQYVTERSTCT